MQTFKQMTSFADIPGIKAVDPDVVAAFMSEIETRVIAPLVAEAPVVQLAIERARNWPLR